MWKLNEYKNEQSTITLRSGIRIPCIGFGTWKMPPEVAEEAVQEAIKAGYRHIDTATAYCNETGVGAGIRKSGIKREELFLVTKLPNADHGYAKTKASDSRKIPYIRRHVQLLPRGSSCYRRYAIPWRRAMLGGAWRYAGAWRKISGAP